MVLRKASAAFAAGCTVIAKPSPETPLSALTLAYLAEKAGYPKGVFNVLPTSLTNTPPLSEALCRHPTVKKVSFTGSVSQALKSLMIERIVNSNLLDPRRENPLSSLCGQPQEAHSRAGRKLPLRRIRRCEPNPSLRW